jgi:hypothetical protein
MNTKIENTVVRVKNPRNARKGMTLARRLATMRHCTAVMATDYVGILR